MVNELLEMNNETTPVGAPMGDGIVEEVPSPMQEPSVEPIAVPTEPLIDMQVPEAAEGSKELADATMAHIYNTINEGTKSDQLALSAERYISELFDIGQVMPEVTDLVEAQKILFDMYNTESKSEVIYDDNSMLSRLEVDGINGNLQRRKRVIQSIREAMVAKRVITPQLDILSVPEGATKEQIKAIQTKVGTKADGIVGPKTLQAIDSFNLDRRMEAREQQPSNIDPETGLAIEVATDTSQSDVASKIGMPNRDVSKLIELESSNVGYEARNPKSSAYGKYQFMTYNENSTGTIYAKKLGYRGNGGDDLRKWMTPERQDKMFVEFTKDNIQGLKSKKLPTDLFHIYGAHQQGLSGLTKILSGDTNATIDENMRKNLPEELSKLSGKALADAWIAHWKIRTTA